MEGFSLKRALRSGVCMFLLYIVFPSLSPKSSPYGFGALFVGCLTFILLLAGSEIALQSNDKILEDMRQEGYDIDAPLDEKAASVWVGKLEIRGLLFLIVFVIIALLAFAIKKQFAA